MAEGRGRVHLVRIVRHETSLDNVPEGMAGWETFVHRRWAEIVANGVTPEWHRDLQFQRTTFKEPWVPVASSEYARRKRPQWPSLQSILLVGHPCGRYDPQVVQPSVRRRCESGADLDGVDAANQDREAACNITHLAPAPSTAPR